MCRAVSLQSPVAMGTLRIYRKVPALLGKVRTFLWNNLYLQLWPRPNGEGVIFIIFFLWHQKHARCFLHFIFFHLIFSVPVEAIGDFLDVFFGSQPTHGPNNLSPTAHLDQDCSPLKPCPGPGLPQNRNDVRRAVEANR